MSRANPASAEASPGVPLRPHTRKITAPASTSTAQAMSSEFLGGFSMARPAYPSHRRDESGHLRRSYSPHTALGQRVTRSWHADGGTMTKEKAQARREHLQKMRAQQKSKERRAALLMWGAGGLVIVLLVGVVGFYLVKQAKETSLGDVANYKYEAGQHVWNTVTYKETPPVGGQHNNYWQQSAVYAKPIHNEHAVHSLEHGALWITYRPDLPKAQVDALKKTAT